MPSLTVPVPDLKFETRPAGLAALEKPVEVRSAAATFPDGTPVGQGQPDRAGFFVYRRAAPGASEEIWDPAGNEWKPATSAAPTNLTPQPFLFKSGAALPWQGSFVALGQKDKNGADQFSPAIGIFPQYFVRAYFSAIHQGQLFSGLSAPSPVLRFVSLAQVPLTVPVPDLKFEVRPAGLAALEKPVEVRSAAVTFPDGTPVGQGQPDRAGFFVYRRAAPGASEEIWDPAGNEWKPATSAAPTNLTPQPFLFKSGAALPWQGLFVALGQKDKNGADQFSPAIGIFPQYFVRAYFSAIHQGQLFSGLSAPSPVLRFVSLAQEMRAGIGIVPGEPQNATEVVLFLRDAAQQEIGMVKIRASGSGSEIEIANGTAVVRLLPSGELRLEPTVGQRVIIAGDLETERIWYLPSTGLPKQLLM